MNEIEIAGKKFVYNKITKAILIGAAATVLVSTLLIEEIYINIFVWVASGVFVGSLVGFFSVMILKRQFFPKGRAAALFFSPILGFWFMTLVLFIFGKFIEGMVTFIIVTPIVLILFAAELERMMYTRMAFDGYDYTKKTLAMKDKDAAKKKVVGDAIYQVKDFAKTIIKAIVIAVVLALIVFVYVLLK